jgi:hypothetical protein
MILTKKVKVKVKGNNKIKYFIEKGEVKDDDLIIDVKYLLPNSSNIIEAKCDFCGKLKEIKYSNYYRNIERSTLKKYACSLKCSKLKKEHTNLIRYGEKHPLKNIKIREKIERTNKQKYGSDYIFKSEEIKEKIKKTNLSKYGVDNPFKSEEIKEKIKKTNLSKYGVDNPFKSEEIKEKIKETNLSKFKSIYIVNSEMFINKLDSIKEKIKETNQIKYEKNHISKSEDYSKKNMKIANDINYVHYIGEGISKFKCDREHIFEINSDNYSHRTKLKIPLCTVCNPIGDLKSIKEKEILNYIKSIYKDSVIQSYRDFLEIDIYLPELKIGFEFNGLYWHSELFKDKNYHLEKTKYFKNRGIRIIHIWEDDWTFKGDIVKSQIKNWLGLIGNKIFARNCYIKEIDNSASFLNENHIQGSDKSKLKIGLYQNEELVSLMTFDMFEGRVKMEEGGWNLSRFSNKLDTVVIGGASKLLKYFIKKYKPIRIISYADKSWSNGGLYFKLNFNLIDEIKPDYKYLIENRRVHKSRYRKSNLDTTLSESQYMSSLNINRIWDCGKIKFELNLKDTKKG